MGFRSVVAATIVMATVVGCTSLPTTPKGLIAAGGDGAMGTGSGGVGGMTVGPGDFGGRGGIVVAATGGTNAGGTAGIGAGGMSGPVCANTTMRSCAEDGKIGNCAKGTETCVGGQWTSCSISPQAADSCSIAGDDANCNGALNEGCACLGSTLRSCDQDGFLGNCSKGTETCSGGKWGACSIPKQVSDSCTVSGDDANCDGTPNGGCTCVSGTTQPCGPKSAQGICKRGTQGCVNNQWGACQDAVYPAARDCSSSLDNDCDGKPDNTIDSVCACVVGASQACSTHPGNDGKGPCKAGQQTCVAGANGATTAFGACTGAVGPASSDTCDQGNDANCNGAANDGCTCLNGTTGTCGAELGTAGPCASFKATCSGGKWTGCASTSQTDTCDLGNDANCNGTANDGCRYILHPGAVVYDTSTSLYWQQTVPSTTYNYTAASTYCTTLGGGWDIPSATELVTLVVETMSPTIDKTVFPDTPTSGGGYWTTTPYGTTSGYYYLVDFAVGKTFGNSVTVTNYVRCRSR